MQFFCSIFLRDDETPGNIDASALQDIFSFFFLGGGGRGRGEEKRGGRIRQPALC